MIDPQTIAHLAPVEKLLAIMAILRDKEKGCPWDIKQNFATIAPCTIEEAYEVVDAIERQNMPDLQEELGDLLFQVVFYAQMAMEAGLFDFNSIAETMANKLIDRHPHVFSFSTTMSDDKAVLVQWEDIKAKERANKQENNSQLSGVAMSLPALLRAAKLAKRAARTGFEWQTFAQAMAKIEEEITELKDALNSKLLAEQEEELGDLLFAVACLANKAGFCPEEALRKANHKFTHRFQWMEKNLAEQKKELSSQDLSQLQKLWQQAKNYIK
ncbi:MAG: nucleoside triphosphate pyrophosphohydrolase [Alphaproteobacteria bacterium]